MDIKTLIQNKTVQTSKAKTEDASIVEEIERYMPLSKRDKARLFSSLRGRGMPGGMSVSRWYEIHRQAIKACKDRGIGSVNYLFGIINNLKK